MIVQKKSAIVRTLPSALLTFFTLMYGLLYVWVTYQWVVGEIPHEKIWWSVAALFLLYPASIALIELRKRDLGQ
jgi:hypothetical protein